MDGLIYLDGAMGTQLQAMGLGPGEIPERWNLLHPDRIRSVHEAYLSAGSDIVYANTFGANRAKYHGEEPLDEIVAAGIAIAREAAAHVPRTRGPARVALDVGPCGRLLKPSGDFE